MLITAETQDVADMTIAKDVAETLHKHYPGHLWAVSIRGGVIYIQNFSISKSWGMVVHLTSYSADPSNKKVVRMAGEFLERAHLKRGRDTGEDAQILEGVAQKYQPSNGFIR